MALILILEDNLSTQRALVDEFRSEGHEVIATDNGTEALKLIFEKKPDGMVFDLEVKGMNGEDLLGRLASMPNFNLRTPIFVNSSRFNFGQDWLSRPKPVDMGERVEKKSEHQWKGALNIIHVKVKPGALEIEAKDIQWGWIRKRMEEAIKKSPPSSRDVSSYYPKVRLPKILVIENDARFRGHLFDVLEKEGYDIQVAENGADAFEKLKAFYPDIITLDLMMPVMSGTEFLQKIRQMPEYKNIPIVVASSAGKPGIFGESNSEKKLKETADDEIKARVQPNKKIIEKEAHRTFFSKDGSISSIVNEVKNVGSRRIVERRRPGTKGT